MSEFVKKTALGYRPVPGGHSDPECSHVILAKKQYDQILQEKKQAEQEKRNTEYEVGRSVKRAQDNALRQAQKAQEEAWKSVEALIMR